MQSRVSCVQGEQAPALRQKSAGDKLDFVRFFFFQQIHYSLFRNHFLTEQQHDLSGGERGGSVVECRTPEREVGVRNLPPPCCVLEQDTLLPESTS